MNQSQDQTGFYEPQFLDEIDGPVERAVFTSSEQEIRAFGNAHRHSGIVRWLRIILPLLGVFILSILIGAYFWSRTSLPEIEIGTASFDNGKMVMKNPELNGVDKEQRPYNLTAKEAITDPRQPKQVELLEIDANVPMSEGIFAKILAGTGFYDAEAKKLKLGGEVDVKTDDGITMRLQDADVDIGLGTLLTDNPISITTEQATISSQALEVRDSGETVVFKTRVKMTIYPEKIEQAKTQNNSNN